MNGDHSEPELEPHAHLALYLETLRARLPEEQFGILAGAVREAAALLAGGREGIVDASEELHPDLHQEFTTVLTILATGRLDHHRVEVTADDGSRLSAMVDPDAAEDPARLEEIRGFLQRWHLKKRAVEEQLDGIARASDCGGADA
ncbi:hypothetical protein AB0K89_26235 [Streptomyces cinnamoneus]|uniref:hypothetical protein n=1 Tax=Streptomyces cinnamoneus TaxID=53446 RepID=UPI00342AD258